MVCHTVQGGEANAGGRAFETPFGTIYSTNLTPDPETGIGKWSFSAFQRAMREGISRDGSHLYPAFPYTSFTKVTDEDLMAIYAYLMSRPPVRADNPPNDLRFPYSVRPLMAMWNALYLKPGPDAPDPSRSALWNRGAYLVNGLGHCAACHSPRNALGAEQDGRQYLGGAFVDGWEAPPLSALGRAPVRWTEEELFRYLRHGHSTQHGAAAGPMLPVVEELSKLPEQDVRAMAHYLASFTGAPAAHEAATSAREAVQLSKLQSAQMADSSARLFDTACGSCHDDGGRPGQPGRNIHLALNSNLHSDTPDNLVQVILHGIRAGSGDDAGYMPAFRDSLDDEQIGALAAHMRQRFAPDKPAWGDVRQTVARLRGSRPD